MQVNPKIDQLHVKKLTNSSTYIGFIAFKALIVCGVNFSLKWHDRSVGPSDNSHFVKGPDIKKQEKRVCHAVTMHILTKDYSNFIIYTVWFSFLSLKIWFVVGSSFLLVQFDAYLAK